MRVMISVFVDKEGPIYVQRIVVIYVTWHVLATKNWNEVGSTNDSLHIDDLRHWYSVLLLQGNHPHPSVWIRLITFVD